VFFNLPYSARLLLHSLQAIPTQQYKLAAHLGMSPWQRFRFIEWPRLRLQLPSVAGLVFMLCFTSFATVMALGGGPSSTTIELAIYQAIKYDFDLATGAWLAVWQILLCSSFALFFQHFSKVVAVGSGSSSDERIAQPDSWFAKMGDGFAIFMVVIIVFPPLLMVLGKGLTPELWQVMFSSSLWNALWDSLRVALVAGTLAVSAGISIIWSSRVLRINGYIKRADFTELCGSLILLTPGLVISTGLFLLLRPIANIQQMGYGIVVLVNAMMALPYVLKTLAQPMFVMSQRYNQLCSALGVSGWTRFRLIEWRELREPMVHACVISFLVSMGDLSAIALFGNQDFRTLPLYLYQLLGSYQMDAAAAVAFLMLCISGGAFVVSSRLFRVQRKSC
jgi:thiamine transport system permease protein